MTGRSTEAGGQPNPAPTAGTPITARFAAAGLTWSDTGKASERGGFSVFLTQTRAQKIPPPVPSRPAPSARPDVAAPPLPPPQPPSPSAPSSAPRTRSISSPPVRPAPTLGLAEVQRVVGDGHSGRLPGVDLSPRVVVALLVPALSRRPRLLRLRPHRPVQQQGQKQRAAPDPRPRPPPSRLHGPPSECTSPPRGAEGRWLGGAWPPCGAGRAPAWPHGAAPPGGAAPARSGGCLSPGESGTSCASLDGKRSGICGRRTCVRCVIAEGSCTAVSRFPSDSSHLWQCGHFIVCGFTSLYWLGAFVFCTNRCSQFRTTCWFLVQIPE